MMMRDDYNYRFKLTDYTQLDRNRKRKVAVYGRVSTEHEAQIAALENQMQWYDDQARYHPNWEIQDRYIDEGITGTQAKKRPSFLRMIFDLYLQGKGSLQIANELNARHRKSAMGLVKWCASSVVRVLKNATYTGTKCYNKSRSNNYLEQHRVLNLDASTYQYHEGDFPAIVSKEIWNKAQSIRINRRKAVALRDGKVTISNRSSEDIWVNKLRCSCGYACRRDKWHVRKDGSISYGYQCYNRINNGSKQKREEMGLDSEGYCGIRMYGDWKLEMMADTLFEQLLGDKHQIIQTALELLKKYYRETSRKDQQGNSERKIQLERIDTRLRNLTVMRADGEIGKEEYQKLRDQLEAEKSRLEAAQAAIKNPRK